MDSNSIVNRYFETHGWTGFDVANAPQIVFRIAVPHPIETVGIETGVAEMANHLNGATNDNIRMMLQIMEMFEEDDQPLQANLEWEHADRSYNHHPDGWGASTVRHDGLYIYSVEFDLTPSGKIHFHVFNATPEFLPFKVETIWKDK